ncbi:hypothetical protein B0H14DRAFT_3506027 [Mycena olivaceomarginata]|nr:hypothetical protein B0H14DRAFT_3506027 [Mycena olivaceomarginata]
MTPEMIGCAAVQARTMLSTKDWRRRDGAFNYETLHDQVVALFSGLPGDEWAVDTLAWFQRMVFGDSTPSGEEGGVPVPTPNAASAILAQRAARQAASQPTPSAAAASRRCFLLKQFRLIKVSTIVVILFVLVCIILPSFNIHGSLCILGTRARIIVFQHFARSLLPLASTTTTHRDIKLK